MKEMINGLDFVKKRRYWIKNKTTDIINTQNLHKYLLTDVIDEKIKLIHLFVIL